ncbi:MAG TPA: PKD domain-containing protein [Candidatus Thermoplasmatota archaeon]|nr:PKD domain-containing protein [Candidatus Thermoplasmatota archaeon]
MRALVPVLLVALLLAHPALGSVPEEPTPAERALAFVASKQRSDGRWDLYTQGYVAEAAASAGRDPAAWPSAERSAFDALRPEACAHLALPAERDDCVYKSVLRIVHAAGASGHDPRALHGLDGVERVRAGFVGGQFGQPMYINDDIWAVLALRAAGVPASDAMVRAAVDVIWKARGQDGGWGDRAVAPTTSVDMTGMALAALAAAGEDVRGDAAARAFVLRHWHASGGFRSIANGGPNCQSTVWAIHALDVLGATTNASALEFLLGLQRDDGGFAISASSGASDLFCTVEAAVVVAGERYPLPSYAKVAAPRVQAHAKEPVALAVGGFSRATWTFADATLEGAQVSRVFDAAGSHPYRLVAETATTRGRASGVVDVLSARPQLGTFPANVTTFRNTPVTLDLAAAHDPDGAIARFEVDWGDGAWTNGTDRRPAHAYALPGVWNATVRALDDAGVWSHPARFSVLVENRAPVLAPLPARLVADRVHGVALHVNASDPDGDALTGTGTRTLRFEALGEHVHEVVVADPYGGEARANVTIEVVNLPPVVRILPPVDAVEDEPFELRAEASDPDGPAPALAWSLGPLARLPAGEHTARVTATDADGARANATLTFLVRPRDAPAASAPSEPAAEIRAFEAALAHGELTVRFDAVGLAIVRWRSDAGDGERAGAQSPLVVPLPRAAWAVVALDVAQGGSTASRQSPLLVPPQEERAALPPPEPEPVVVRPAEEPRAAEPTPLAPVDLIPQGSPGARRETPLPWALALAALALATRGRRAR